MAKRYDHMMDIARSQCWPAKAIVVDCESVTKTEQNGKACRREELIYVHMSCLRKVNDSYEVYGREEAPDQGKFWKILELWPKAGESCVVLSCGCMRTWSLLGLWEEMEDGYLSISGQIQGSNISSKVPGMRKTGTIPERREPTNTMLQMRFRDKPSGYIVAGDPPSILRARIKSTGAWITWLDTRNFGYSIPAGTANGKQTCELLTRWLCDFYAASASYRLGGLKTTASSQAMHAFRANYHKSAIYCHCEPKALDLEEKALHGGRCECFRIGKVQEPLWHYDFRSLYAHIAITRTVPIRLRAVYSSGYEPTSEWSGTTFQGIADCTVETSEPIYPCRRDGLVIYPVGQFRAVLTGLELQEAVNRDHIRMVHRVAVYDYGQVLKEVTGSFYEMRQQSDNEGNRGIGQMAKFLYCGLIGCLAKRQRWWVNVENTWTDQLWGEWTGGDGRGHSHRYRAIAGTVQREEIAGFAPESVPAITASIMADARHYLLQAIRTAGWENVYYADTDSLFVNETGRSNLERAGWLAEGVLGKLQHKNGPANVEICGIKHYVINGKRTCSGLPFGEYRDAGDGLHYWYTTSAAWQIAHGRRPDYVQRMGRYERQNSYPLSQVDASGRCTPFRLKEDYKNAYYVNSSW